MTPVMKATLRLRSPSLASSPMRPDLYSTGAVCVSAPVGTGTDMAGDVDLD